LHYAAYYGRRKCVEKLLQYGADKSLKDVWNHQEYWERILIWDSESLNSCKEENDWGKEWQWDCWISELLLLGRIFVFIFVEILVRMR
jgi:hypothetical protein